MATMMSNTSYYHCTHCTEDVCVEIKCPCCNQGNPECQDKITMEIFYSNFLSWLKVHSAGYRMCHDAKGWAIDFGYIMACDVIGAELKRLIEEHKDDSQ